MKGIIYTAGALVLVSCAATYSTAGFAHRSFAMAASPSAQYGGKQTLSFSEDTAEYKTGDIMRTAAYRVEGRTLILRDRQGGQTYKFSILSPGRLKDAYGNIYTAQ